MTSASWVPVAKVKGGAAAGAVTTIGLWLLEEFARLQLPGPVQAAIGVLVTLGVAYLVPGAAQPVPDDPAVDERPLSVDERQQIVEIVDWFAPRQDKRDGG